MAELPVVWSEGWLWLIGSLVLAALCANLAWFFRRSRSDAISRFVTRLVTWRFSPWLLQFLRLLYYIGVPFAALLWGHDAVVERLLGLQRFDLPPPSFPPMGGDEGRGAGANLATHWLDWTYDVGWAAALGVGAWALLALGWWAYRRALIAVGEAGVGEGGGVVGADSSGWVLLREAAYHEVHWAFCRNMPIRVTDTYWGVWIGLALVALEAALSPAWHKGLADAQQAPAQLMRGALAVISSISFLLTQNLWLALILHWGISWGLAALVRTFPILPTHEPDRIPG